MKFPSGSCRDASQLREVPDHQEVFTCEADGSVLIIEILDINEEVSSKSMASFHFEELAAENDAAGPGEAVVCKVENMIPDDLPLLQNAKYEAQYLDGTQKISKLRESAENDVHIFLVCIRLTDPAIASEILVTLNVPTYVHEKSSTTRILSPGNQPLDIESYRVAFRQMLESFQVCDWHLFG